MRLSANFIEIQLYKGLHKMSYKNNEHELNKKYINAFVKYTLYYICVLKVIKKFEVGKDVLSKYQQTK